MQKRSPGTLRKGAFLVVGSTVLAVLAALGIMAFKNADASTASLASSVISGVILSNGSPTTTTTTTTGCPVKTGTSSTGTSSTDSDVDYVLTVVSVSGQNILAKKSDGTSITVVTNSSTKYELESKHTAGTLADVTAGQQIRVQATPNSDGTITAERIDIGTSSTGTPANKRAYPGDGGVITQITDTAITVKDCDGTTLIIKVSSSTTYTDYTNSSTGTKITLSDLKVGEFVEAKGTVNSDGSITATSVSVGAVHMPGGHDDHGGQGGHDDRGGQNDGDGH